MAEPTGVLTTEELLLRVSEKMDMSSYDANGLEYVTTSQPNLNMFLRIINNGIKMFMHATPQPSGKWNWMKRDHTVLFVPAGDGVTNIDSDAARYLLPAEFNGQIAGDIKYKAETGHSTRIEWCHPDDIAEYRRTTISTGYPTRAALKRYSPAGPGLGTARQWEIIFDPQPSAANTVVFPYIVYFNALQAVSGSASAADDTTLTATGLSARYPDDYFNDWIIKITSGTGEGSYASVTDFAQSTGIFTVADWLDISGAAGGTDPSASSTFLLLPQYSQHPAGHGFDDAVLSACLARAEMEDQDELQDNHWTQDYMSRALPAAWKHDLLSAPRQLGNILDKRPHRRIRGVITYDTL